MVVELLLTGQQLYPFTAANQYDVASSVNGLLTSYPHLQELSNIGVSIYHHPDPKLRLLAIQPLQACLLATGCQFQDAPHHAG